MPSFCDHCQGQRFDRARVLRALRQIRKDLRHRPGRTSADDVIELALRSVMSLDLPHLEYEEDENPVIH